MKQNHSPAISPRLQSALAVAAVVALLLLAGVLNAAEVNQCEAAGHDRAWCLAILNP